MPNHISEIKFCNVLTDILQEIESHPDDSVQDIVNDKLEEWEIEDITCDHCMVVRRKV